MKLTQREKENFVRADYYFGRLWAMENVCEYPQYSKDTKLQILFNRLFDYDDFGYGDEYETKCWDDILDYLELRETYEKLWDDLYEPTWSVEDKLRSITSNIEENNIDNCSQQDYNDLEKDNKIEHLEYELSQAYFELETYKTFFKNFQNLLDK